MKLKNRLINERFISVKSHTNSCFFYFASFLGPFFSSGSLDDGKFFFFFFFFFFYFFFFFFLFFFVFFFFIFFFCFLVVFLSIFGLFLFIFLFIFWVRLLFSHDY